MQIRDIEALVKAIEARGFQPATDKEKHTLGMARQAIMFKRELKWPEDMALQGTYRRVYENI